MKSAPKAITLNLTAIAVKTYMLIAVLWSKSNEQYKAISSFTKQILTATPAAQHA